MAVNLSKGQKISLDKGMTLALVGLGWDTNRYSGGAEFDLDASAFLLGANGKVRKDEDFIFYGNLKSADGSVTHTGDNRTGEGEGDDEVLSVEAENILAFTGDCDYNVRFLGMGVVSQKGIATSTLTGRGDSAYVAVLSDGNPLVMNNRKSRATISVDPDAVICWMGQEGDNCDPQIRTDINWKTLIGQASGESYAYEWGGNQPVTVIVQPSERKGGIRLAVD